MKRNELTETKGLDLKTLRSKAASLKDEIANLVMDKNMKKLKNVKVISKKRKDLAQILTIARQKQLLEQLEKETSVQENKVSNGQSDIKNKQSLSSKEGRSKKGDRAGLSKTK